MSRIVYNSKMNTLKADEGISLTGDIADKNRQALACNVIRQMIENGAEITVDGKTIPMEINDLWIASEEPVENKEGWTQIAYDKAHLDSEWYGANKNELYSDEKLTVKVMCHYDVDAGEEPVIMDIVNTGSYEKANEVLNFLYQGIDKSVTISLPTEDGMKPVIVNGTPVGVSIRDGEDEIRSEHFERNWMQMKASDIEPKFTGTPKYELTDVTQEIWGGGYSGDFREYDKDGNERAYGTTYGDGQAKRTVYQIRALRDFGDVKAGDLGGYVESESNLSHAGNCWIYDDAVVCCDAVVKDDAAVRDEVQMQQGAVVSGSANVFGKAYVKNNAVVSDNAKVGYVWDGVKNKSHGWESGEPTLIKDNAQVTGNAQVLGEVIVADNAQVTGNAAVEGKWPASGIESKTSMSYAICAVLDNSVIEDNAQVRNVYTRGNAHIHENAFVFGHPKMGGHAEITGNAEVAGNAKITHNVTISENAKVRGFANIQDKITIGSNADIQENGDYYSLKPIGKNSFAVRNQEGGLTIKHKGKTYDNIEDLKAAVGNINAKGLETISGLEQHFESRMENDFTAAVAAISEDSKGLQQ